MKSFKQFLLEGLNKDQKEIVDSWGSSDIPQRISGHVIPAGQHRVTIPLEDPSERVDAHPDVEKHLRDNGYDIHDYRKGLALEPPKTNMMGKTTRRPIKIGKALEATNAPDELKKTYVTHSNEARKGGTASGLQIVVSRHPHDVAAMSTGQGWESCMTMGGGSNEHYLKNDVLNGTHVAYLTKAGEKQSNNPADHAIARIALKPYHGSDGSTILHPENKLYGDADSTFERAVGNWANQHFPLKDNVNYKKDEELYDDSDRPELYSFDTAMNHEDQQVRASAFTDHADKITRDHITNAINDNESRRVVRAALRHPLANENHYDMAARSSFLMKDPRVVSQVALRGNADHLTQIMSRPDNYGVHEALANKNFTKDHMDMMMKNKTHLMTPYDVSEVSSHPTFGPDHMGQILSMDQPQNREELIQKLGQKSFDSMSKTMHKMNKNVKIAAIESRPGLVTDDHLTNMFSNPHEHPEVIQAAYKAKTDPNMMYDGKLKSSHIELLKKHHFWNL